MSPTRILAVAAVVLAVAIGATSAAKAEQPYDRCPGDATAAAPGAGPACDAAAWSEDRRLPAGTRCSFDVAIHIDFSATFYHFDNPPRTDGHIVAVGTATNLENQKTLTRIARFTEITSARESSPITGEPASRFPTAGRSRLAGFTQDSEVPPPPKVFHGNPFDDADAAAFCAALS